jgi:hypothetical protein
MANQASHAQQVGTSSMAAVGERTGLSGDKVGVPVPWDWARDESRPEAAG